MAGCDGSARNRENRRIEIAAGSNLAFFNILGRDEKQVPFLRALVGYQSAYVLIIFTFASRDVVLQGQRPKRTLPTDGALSVESDRLHGFSVGRRGVQSTACPSLGHKTSCATWGAQPAS